MRDFFIQALEMVIHVIVVLTAVGLVLAALAVMTGLGGMAHTATGLPGGSIVAGLALLVFGGLYLVLVAGFLYLGLGIYQNTRRTAAALEDLARRR